MLYVVPNGREGGREEEIEVVLRVVFECDDRVCGGAFGRLFV